MPRILKSQRAQADIAEIWDFIAEDSETQADDFIDTLDETFNFLRLSFLSATPMTNWPKISAAFLSAIMHFYLAQPETDQDVIAP